MGKKKAKKVEQLEGFFHIVFGITKSGKTTYVLKYIKDHSKPEDWVIYITSNYANVEVDEKEVVKLIDSRENSAVLTVDGIGKPNIENIINFIKEKEGRKWIIVDNLTYSLGPEFLNLTTYVRKYNAILFLICHSLSASKFFPRLKEQCTNMLLFKANLKPRSFSHLAPDNLELRDDYLTLIKPQKDTYDYILYKCMEDTYDVKKQVKI